MGKRAQEVEKIDEGDLGSVGANSEDPRKGKPGRRPKQKASEPDAAEVQQAVLRHFFPDFVEWLKDVRDPRCKERCTYPIEYIMMTVLLMHCGQCGSRRQLGRELAGKRLSGNIWRLIGKAYSQVTCHPDTMNNVMESLDPAELDGLFVKVFSALRKSRALDKFRFSSLLCVAVDATGLLSFNTSHCNACTYQTHGDKTKYFHNVLIAKVVTPCGLTIPLAFEFIENPDGEYDKQDCEIKAWRRLSAKIRKLYPRLKINLLADGLYAEETTFTDCDKENVQWNYIITLPDDKLPSVRDQLPSSNSDKGWTGTRTVTIKRRDGKVEYIRKLRWKTPLRYHGEIVHVIELEETNPEGERLYYNRWITNVKPQYRDAHDLAQTGRLRWKIENEGINTPKNAGYEMQHGYGLKGNAWKNYYLTLQISQLINDLVRFTDYIQKSTADPKTNFSILYGTIRNYAKRLLECLRWCLPDFTPSGKIQIRFLT
ncbi:MAG: hypothetical protein GY799_24065 [Desulfobulbaceae bacterium]|nr:hypothetical protein [Desulfobulbaceae bacterium]